MYKRQTIEWAQPFERYIVIDNYRSDELDYRPDVTAWMELAMYNNESTNYVPNDEWTNLYTSINYCNQCLDNIPNVPDNDDEGIKQTKATSIAEARFLRAFYYYRLFIKMCIRDRFRRVKQCVSLGRTLCSIIVNTLFHTI